MENEKTNEKTNEWKKREIGALWKKSGKTQNYFSGRINIKNIQNEELVNIVGFSNKGKAENPNSPDVILYISENTSSSNLDLSGSQKKEVSAVSSNSSVDDETPEF